VGRVGPFSLGFAIPSTLVRRLCRGSGHASGPIALSGSPDYPLPRPPARGLAIDTLLRGTETT